MTNIYTIYKATNTINGKCYIGFDSDWPNRKAVHKCNSKKDKNKKYHFYRAINKYGWENFQWEIIYQSKDKKHTLTKIEPYFIKFYNSYNEGYNMTFGGEGVFVQSVSLETRKKQSLAKIGHKMRIKFWSFLSPNGEVVEFYDLKNFCKEKELNQSNMTAVAYGRRPHHKGWKYVSHQ